MNNCNDNPKTIGLLLIPKKFPIFDKEVVNAVFNGKSVDLITKRGATIRFKKIGNHVKGRYIQKK